MIKNWATKEEVVNLPQHKVFRVHTHYLNAEDRLISIHNSSHKQLYMKDNISKALSYRHWICCFPDDRLQSAINYAGNMYDITGKEDVSIWVCTAYGVLVPSKTGFSAFTEYIEPKEAILGKDDIQAQRWKDIGEVKYDLV